MNTVLFKDLKVGDEFKNFPEDTDSYIKVSHSQGRKVEDVDWIDEFAQYEPIYVDYN